MFFSLLICLHEQRRNVRKGIGPVGKAVSHGRLLTNFCVKKKVRFIIGLCWSIISKSVYSLDVLELRTSMSLAFLDFVVNILGRSLLCYKGDRALPSFSTILESI